MRYALFCLSLLGLGLAGIITQWMAVPCLLILVQKPVMNWGILAGLVLLPLALTAEVEGDSIMYDVPLAMRTLAHHSLNFSLDNIVGLCISGSDLILTIAPEHGRIISCLCFTACSIILWDMMDWAGAGREKWLAPVFVLTAEGVLRLAASSKYDSPMILFSFISAWYYQRNRFFSAGLAMGCACACKIQAVPLLVGMALFGGSLWRVVLGGAVLMVPWIARQYLMMGHGLFPYMGSDFSEQFMPSIRRAQYALTILKGRGLWNTVVYIWSFSPIVAVLLPFMRGRMALIGVFGGAGIWLLLENQSRYLLPCLPFLAIPAMKVLARSRPYFRMDAVGHDFHYQYLRAGTGRKRIRRLLAVYATAASIALIPTYLKYLHQPPIPASYIEAMAACEGKRVIGWGEERKYPGYNPANIMWSYSSLPMMWQISKEAASPERMRVRFRQMKVDHMLINFPSLQTQGKYSGPFPWRGWQARRYYQFCRKYMVLEWQGTVFDGAGSYLLMGITKRKTR